MSENDKKENTSEDGFRAYTIKVADPVFDRVDRHIGLLKFVKGGDASKQKWLQEAIREKLTTDPDFTKPEPKTRRHLHTRLEYALSEQLESRIQLLRERLGHANKNQWLVDAIHEKLEREQSLAQEALESLSS